jgi:hypothetical protein
VSQQQALFDATPVAQSRKHDPRTAKAAAALDPEGRASQAQRILRYLYRFGGTITADRAYRLLTLADEEITRGEWSSRIGVLISRGLLERAGEVEDVGRRARRRQVLAYRLTQAGEAETERMFGRPS